MLHANNTTITIADEKDMYAPNERAISTKYKNQFQICRSCTNCNKVLIYD